MSDYTLWVLESNELYVLVQFCDVYVSERRIWEVQKKFVNEGYEVRKVETSLSGTTTVEFFKTDGIKEYAVQEFDELEDTKNNE